MFKPKKKVIEEEPEEIEEEDDIEEEEEEEEVKPIQKKKLPQEENPNKISVQEVVDLIDGHLARALELIKLLK